MIRALLPDLMNMIELYLFFLLIGITIFFGSAASIFFQRTKISQVILLMLLGILLGPALGWVDAKEGSILASTTPFLGTFAFIILLFDGGLKMDIRNVLQAALRSTVFTLLVFALSIILSACILMYFFHWGLLYAILLGIIVGGTCSATVNTLLENTSMRQEGKAALILESTITDVLCIIGAFLVIEIILRNSPSIGDVFMLFGNALFNATIIGIVGAFLWLIVLARLGEHRNPYMLTMAFAFIIYGITQAVHGNGTIAVFVYGLALGNIPRMLSNYKIENKLALDQNILGFQEEVTFFIRTFFFVLIGLGVSFEYFSIPVLLSSFAIILISVIVRHIISGSLFGDFNQGEKRLITVMIPRGLAAAILATAPLQAGLVIPFFSDIVIVIIFLSNVFSSLGILLFDRTASVQQNKSPY